MNTFSLTTSFKSELRRYIEPYTFKIIYYLAITAISLNRHILHLIAGYREDVQLIISQVSSIMHSYQTESFPTDPIYILNYRLRPCDTPVHTCVKPHEWTNKQHVLWSELYKKPSICLGYFVEWKYSCTWTLKNQKIENRGHNLCDIQNAKELSRFSLSP